MGLINDLNNTPRAQKLAQKAQKEWEENLVPTEKYCKSRNVFIMLLWFIFVAVPIAALDIARKEGDI